MNVMNEQISYYRELAVDNYEENKELCEALKEAADIIEALMSKLAAHDM